VKAGLVEPVANATPVAQNYQQEPIGPCSGHEASDHTALTLPFYHLGMPRTHPLIVRAAADVRRRRASGSRRSGRISCPKAHACGQQCLEEPRPAEGRPCRGLVERRPCPPLPSSQAGLSIAGMTSSLGSLRSRVSASCLASMPEAYLGAVGMPKERSRYSSGVALTPQQRRKAYSNAIISRTLRTSPLQSGWRSCICSTTLCGSPFRQAESRSTESVSEHRVGKCPMIVGSCRILGRRYPASLFELLRTLQLPRELQPSKIS